MFGEYAQIVSYMQPPQTVAYQKVELPSYLNPTFQPPQPWDHGRTKSGLGEDFIMIAEFSELEGPKPLMTIPKDGGANFDQNSFAVRILAVDHLNPTEGFSISEDAQIVVSDSQAGVFAFVHHMVLYDNTARGFVRPYCIAFITAEQRKLMCFYEELSWKFKKVARFLKYGNKMVFVGDLERHLKDLEYTKNVLLNQVCKIRLRSSERSDDQIANTRKNAENELYRGLQTIQHSSLELREILSVLKPLLPDRRLETRFRILEDRAYQRSSSVGVEKLSLPESGFADFFSAVDELDFRYGSLTEPRISPLALFKPREYKPVLVETKKAKRFNAPLRGLHELCSWGAKEGLRKLRHIHTYFKRDMATLELHKNESKLFRPRCASIYHGQCITGNFLSGVQVKKSLDATGEAEQNWSMLYNYQWSSLGSLESMDSFKSADSCPSDNDHNGNSPTSFQTYDSMSCNIFQSASASPEKEFSLLMSNEYYPDLKTDEGMTYTQSKMSHDFIQNEKNSVMYDIDQRLMATNSGSSPKHLRASSWNERSFSEKVMFSDTYIKSSSLVDTCVLSDLPQKDILSNSDHHNKKVTGMNDKQLSNKEITTGNERSKFSSENELMLVEDAQTNQINCLNIEIGNSPLLGQGENTHSLAGVEIHNRNNLPICESKHLIIHSSQDERTINDHHIAISADAGYCSTEPLDENTCTNVLLKAAQRLSGSMHDIFTVDSHDDDDVCGKGNKFLSKNLSLASDDSLSNAQDKSLPLSAHKEHIVAASTSKSCDSLLSKMLKQEQNLQRNDKVNNLHSSSLQVIEFPNIDSEILTWNDSEISQKCGSEILPQNDSGILQQSGSEIPPQNDSGILQESGPEIPPQNDSGIPQQSGSEIPPQNDSGILQQSGPEIPPQNDSGILQQSGPEIPPQNGSGIPQQSGPEISPQNDSGILQQSGPEISPQNDSGILQQSGPEIPPQNDSGIPQQSGTEIPPQNDSEISKNDFANFCSDSEVPQKSCENIYGDSEISQPSGTGKSQNALDIFVNGTISHVNNSKMSQLDVDNSWNSSDIQHNGTEILQHNGTEISQLSVTSLQKLSNESLSNKSPENRLLSETNGQMSSHGCKRVTTSSEHSHSSHSDCHYFDHHITRANQLHGEKFNHQGCNNCDDRARTRTGSDMSSAFTEISMQDLYPHINSIETESKDGALSERYDAAQANIEHTDVLTSQSTTLWKPRCGVYTVGDWINNLSQARPGFGLSEVLLTYQCLDHVIFSLLCGRPVLVAGSAKMEAEIIKIVNALSVFVPVVTRKSQTVLEWTSRPLKITDLTKLKLIGICRPERRSLDSFVPSAIKKACTVIDVEKRSIVAPPYQGQFIPALMSKKNVLRSDVLLLTYIECWLMGILAKAFIFFHSFCLGSQGSVLYSQSPIDQRDAYHITVSGIMTRLGVKDCDCDIVENLTEIVKLNKMKSGFWQGVDSGNFVCPLTLQNKACERFRC